VRAGGGQAANRDLRDEPGHDSDLNADAVAGSVRFSLASALRKDPTTVIGRVFSITCSRGGPALHLG
jgi:hypothetical protein